MTRGFSLSPLHIGVTALAMAVLVFACEQQALLRIEGWWLDEVYSLWATDPQSGFAEALRDRIGNDQTPPLYYTLLFAARKMAGTVSGRMVTEGLNLALLALASLAVIASALRRHWLPYGLLAVAAFLQSGAVLAYTPEMRAYVLAMGIALCASWLALLSCGEEDKPAPRWFVVLGMLAAATHIYAGLLCGCLAAGLVLSRKPALMVRGLALGLSVTAGFAVWYLTSAGPAMTWTQAWNIFTWPNLLKNLTELQALSTGSALASFATFLLLAYALAAKRTRAVSAVFAIALALFFALPVIESFHVNIINARYWLIGDSLRIVFLVYVLRAGASPARLAALALLVASSAGAYAAAKDHILHKPVWQGAAQVSATAGCAPGTVRVLYYPWLYAQAAGQRPEIFTDAGAEGTPDADVHGSTCPVAGWAEHILKGEGYVEAASDAELLALLKLHAAPGEYALLRHANGFVVLRK